MSSLKQLIYSTLVKCATPVIGSVQPEYETPEAARDAFITMVMADLFPEESVATVTMPVAETKTKIKTPKKSPEDKEAAKAAKEAAKAAKEEAKAAAKAAKEEAKAASPKKSPADKEAEKAAKAAAKEAEKAAAKAAKEAEKEAAKAAKEAEKAAAKAAKEAAKAPAAVPLPASPKPKKSKPTEDANVQKIDPTWRKHLKAVAKTAGKEHSKEMEGELLTYLNGLTKDAFNATKAEDHVKVFLGAAPAPPAPVQEAAPADLEAIEVDFKGKTYFVDPESKRVYEQDGAVYRGVGYVGMAAFAEMEMPEDDA
jgi:hypothetical protein